MAARHRLDDFPKQQRSAKREAARSVPRDTAFVAASTRAIARSYALLDRTANLLGMPARPSDRKVPDRKVSGRIAR
jgi:hypothetical protein